MFIFYEKLTTALEIIFEHRCVGSIKNLFGKIVLVVQSSIFLMDLSKIAEHTLRLRCEYDLSALISLSRLERNQFSSHDIPISLPTNIIQARVLPMQR